ncbi:MAG TPA: DinB family protein [Jatrophihabitans sp.]|nr:DinB family protein [Jatrophihabitans sp.]
MTTGEDRPFPPQNGDERATLSGFLDFQRATFEWKCAGLTPEQLARRSVSPSSMSLLGLARHLTDVERGWFDRVRGGGRRRPMFWSEDDPEGDFDGAVADPAVVEEAFAAWHRAVDESREVVAATDLDATFEHERDGTTSLRWVLAHMLEEYARHNGHADLLREAIDGATGE